MKSRKAIILRKANKRHRNALKRKRRKAKKGGFFLNAINAIYDDQQYIQLLKRWLPPNIRYIVFCPDSDLNIKTLKKQVYSNYGNFKVPKHFSIVDRAKESFRFLQEIVSALIFQTYESIYIDYVDAEKVDLGAQVFLDIIIKEFLLFLKKCSRNNVKTRLVSLGGRNFKRDHIRKMLFTVGSPAIHTNKVIDYKDIVSYKLCVRSSHSDPLKRSAKKELDTTRLVEYVIKCLEKVNKKLTNEKLDDLCTIIGEILINAEEHSSTKYRYSIGYYHESNNDGKKNGVFRLVILNFGNTIYETFRSSECVNTDIKDKMLKLSARYTKKSWFRLKSFEEETLWTLYALQEGVTSIPKEKYAKRGNGSIQFIESFFNIKGVGDNKDDESRMAIYSGNAMIYFDGKYGITEKSNNGDKFKVMTFNNSGKIQDPPDKKYVKFVQNYFPGTIISAKILFNEDDIVNG